MLNQITGIWQKTTKFYKAIILQLKNEFKNKQPQKKKKKHDPNVHGSIIYNWQDREAV